MNKKLLMFGIPLLALCVVLVTAGLVSYYDRHSQEITSISPIVLSGENFPVETFMNMDVRGEPITIENLAENDIDIELTYEAGDSGISVTYLAKLELFNKETENWTEIGEPSEILYVIIGEDFMVENENSGTLAINYIEPSDPYTGAFRLPTDITDSFTGEKFWLIPTESDTNEDKILDSWTPELFMFEHDVIDYTKGDSGVMTIPGLSTIELIPIYHVGMYDGTTTVETIANPIA